MSSFDARAQGVRLNVKAYDNQTEVFVIDGQYRRVARGLGGLNVELPPGLYGIKFKAGSAISETEAVLERGRTEVNIQGPPMYFSSAAPMSYTRTSHEYHCKAAADLSRQVHARLGGGSEIFLFTRDLEVEGPANTMERLSLHALSGERLVDYTVWGGKTSYGNPSAGCNAAVSPGAYRLRVRMSNDDYLEQTVVACPGWQTQVFLTVDDCTPGETTRFPDLATGALFMARQGWGFDWSASEIRLTELARQGLGNRRNVVAQSDLDDMLWAKFENPMFGVYAAHLLLLAAEPDMSLLGTVTGNLYSMIGDHPDVRALDIYLRQRKGEVHQFAAYTAPPVLRSSWDIILAATAVSPELVPLESLPARVSDQLWGNGPWLIWQGSPGDDTDTRPTAPAGTFDLSSAGDFAVRIAAGFDDRRRLQQVVDDPRFTPLEQDLFVQLVRASGVGPRPGAVSQIAAEQKGGVPGRTMIKPASVIKRLGVPASVASATLNGLVLKLHLEDS